MSQILEAWGGDAPRIKAIAQPMPNAPYVFLSGGGSANTSLENYLKSLENDKINELGKYFSYVMGSEGEEADTFTLQAWEVYTSSNSCYEALVILYYFPLNEYLCIKKHKSPEALARFLEQKSKRDAAIASLENLI